MKKHILVLIVLISACIYVPAQAQVSIHVNLGLQPIWGPIGYDYVDYYYIPDIEAYYNVPQQQYTYFVDGRWVTSLYLPPRYRNFDLYHAHKVVINEPNPWMHNDRYRGQYGQYRGRHDQQAIRDSRDQRYYENPKHPMHNQWRGNEGRGNNQPRGNEGRGNQPRGNEGRGNQPRGNEGRGNQPRGNEGRGNQPQPRGNEGRGNQPQPRGNEGRGNQQHGNEGHKDQGH